MEIGEWFWFFSNLPLLCSSRRLFNFFQTLIVFTRFLTGLLRISVQLQKNAERWFFSPLLNPIHSCDLGLKRDRPAWDVRITQKVFKSGYVSEIKPCGICCSLNRFTYGFTIYITIFTILRAYPTLGYFQIFFAISVWVLKLPPSN